MTYNLQQIESFRAAEVTRINGIKRTRLQQWLEKGWIVPSIQVANGHGTRNRYSRHDLYTIGLFKKIIESGLPRRTAGEWLARCREHAVGSGYTADSIWDLPSARSDKSLIVYAKQNRSEPEVFVTDRGPLFQHWIENEEFEWVIMLNLFRIRQDIDREIESLAVK